MEEYKSVFNEFFDLMKRDDMEITIHHFNNVVMQQSCEISHSEYANSHKQLKRYILEKWTWLDLFKDHLKDHPFPGIKPEPIADAFIPDAQRTASGSSKFTGHDKDVSTNAPAAVKVKRKSNDISVDTDSADRSNLPTGRSGVIEQVNTAQVIKAAPPRPDTSTNASDSTKKLGILEINDKVKCKGKGDKSKQAGSQTSSVSGREHTHQNLCKASAPPGLAASTTRESKLATSSMAGIALDLKYQRLAEKFRVDTAEMQRLQAKSAADDKELQELREQSKELQRMREEFSRFREKSIQKDSSISAARTLVKDIIDSVSELMEKHEDYSGEIKNLWRDLNEATRDLRLSKGKVEMLEAENRTFQTELDRLRPVYADLEALQHKHTKLHDLRGKELEECMTLTKQVTSLSDINSTLRTELLEANKKLKQASQVDYASSKKRKISEANES